MFKNRQECHNRLGRGTIVVRPETALARACEVADIALCSLKGKMLSQAELTVSLLEKFENLYLKWRENEQKQST